MRAMRNGELSRLQRHHAEAMQDQCLVLRWNGSEHIPDEKPVACRFVPGSNETIFITSGITNGATFHLPASIEITSQDHFRIISRRGVPVQQFDYMPIGDIDFTPIATVVPTRRLQLDGE